ncbi:hypothetical protein FQA39_LY03900 [Lamprigera yunnana]|nr:hypothetical protein FQA39_LY03900 [Lamprigera yunnana]
MEKKWHKRIRSFSNLNPLEEKEVQSPLPDGEETHEQMSLTQSSVPTQILPTQTLTTTSAELPIHPVCNTTTSNENHTATHRGKKSINRERILETLGKRESGNEMLKYLLIEESENDVDLFFKSLEKSVKNLPNLQQRAKIETLNVIARQPFRSDTSATVSPQLFSPDSNENSLHQSCTMTEVTSITQPYTFEPPKNISCSRNSDI